MFEDDLVEIESGSGIEMHGRVYRFPYKDFVGNLFPVRHDPHGSEGEHGSGSDRYRLVPRMVDEFHELIREEERVFEILRSEHDDGGEVGFADFPGLVDESFRVLRTRHGIRMGSLHVAREVREVRHEEIPFEHASRIEHVDFEPALRSGDVVEFVDVYRTYLAYVRIAVVDSAFDFAVGGYEPSRPVDACRHDRFSNVKK